MDAVEMIEALHDEVRSGLTSILDKGAGTAEAGEIWASLKPLLLHSMAGEETSLYPYLVEARGASPEVTAAVHEHNRVRDAVGQTLEHDRESELFRLALRQVQAAAEYHFAHEALTIGQLLGDLSPDERADMAKRFQHARQAEQSTQQLLTEHRRPSQVIEWAGVVGSPRLTP
jgi:hypothetical protein